MGDPARPGPQFFARSAGEGEGGWFPAPRPLIVGLGAPSLGDAVFRISGVRTKVEQLIGALQQRNRSAVADTSNNHAWDQKREQTPVQRDFVPLRARC